MEVWSITTLSIMVNEKADLQPTCLETPHLFGDITEAGIWVIVSFSPAMLVSPDGSSSGRSGWSRFSYPTNLLSLERPLEVPPLFWAFTVFKSAPNRLIPQCLEVIRLVSRNLSLCPNAPTFVSLYYARIVEVVRSRIFGNWGPADALIV